MTENTWAWSADLETPYVALAMIFAGLSFSLLLLELVRDGRRGRAQVVVGLTGLLGIGSLLLAVLRPVEIEERGESVGAR
ncbi:MAG: hypothetical protein AAGA56_29625, partial [Myxococcota bacterium]